MPLDEHYWGDVVTAVGGPVQLAAVNERIGRPHATLTVPGGALGSYTK
jgi:hypothetical protein